MKYKWGAAVFVLLGVVVFCAPVASAHFPATDKSMTVVLHVDPNDQPIANQPADLNFIYEDQLGKFNFQQCNCIVAISENGEQLYSSASEADEGGGVYGSSLPYTFMQAGVYTINLTGNPKSSGDFVPFKVSWNIRVTPGQGSAPKDEVYYIIGFIGTALVCAGAIGYFIYRDFKGI